MSAMIEAEDLEREVGMAVDDEDFDDEAVNGGGARPNFPAISAVDAMVHNKVFLL
jgi:hypothetical protein